MKKQELKSQIWIGIFCYIVVNILSITSTIAQSGNRPVKASLAILSIDTKGVAIDRTTLRNMVQLEVEKANLYSVLDRYDIEDLMATKGETYSNCFGKSCLVRVGKSLGVDKMLTGNIEKMGNKIVITFRVIDVKSELIESVEAGEFLNMEEELDKMVRISINNLFKLPNDQTLVNLLVDFDTPVNSPKTTLQLNGPRMGASYTIGPAAERLQAPKSQGGYEMFPVVTQFGYQFETQYLSAGTFQALIEYIGMIGGLESGKFIPSVAIMNGFRSSANGWEFAFGPVFKVVQTADGYYDESGDWHLANEWDYETGDNPYEIVELPDNRGAYKFKTNLILGIGRTFKSGYLNIPVNLYVIPNKKGTIVGTSVGFNISKRSK